MWQGYQKSCRGRLRPHVRDRETYVIQHHRLVPPPSGQGHDNMDAYCTNFQQNFLNSHYYFMMMMMIIIIVEIVHVA